MWSRLRRRGGEGGGEGAWELAFHQLARARRRVWERRARGGTKGALRTQHLDALEVGRGARAVEHKGGLLPLATGVQARAGVEAEAARGRAARKRPPPLARRVRRVVLAGVLLQPLRVRQCKARRNVALAGARAAHWGARGELWRGGERGRTAAALLGKRRRRGGRKGGARGRTHGSGRRASCYAGLGKHCNAREARGAAKALAPARSCRARRRPARHG